MSTIVSESGRVIDFGSDCRQAGEAGGVSAETNGAKTRECPFCCGQCERFLAYAQEASPGLARRAKEFYCLGDFKSCARYKAVSSKGPSAVGQRLGPWGRD